MLHLDREDRERLLQIVIGGADGPQTWLEARILLLAAQARSIVEIGELTGADPDTVRAALGQPRSLSAPGSWASPTIASSSR
jgi:hypothetical protein